MNNKYSLRLIRRELNNFSRECGCTPMEDELLETFYQYLLLRIIELKRIQAKENARAKTKGTKPHNYLG